MDGYDTVDASEVPEGFTNHDPNAGGGQAGGQAGGKGQPSAAEREQQMQSILEQVLDDGAYDRLKRIKMVKKEKAVAVENMICQAAMAGKIQGKISEMKLIDMLESLDPNSGRGPKIITARKNYGLDSDDDDDNDDDLM